MITGIDHIVIMVSDLETAASTWGELGFTVVRGGKHPRGTHNALVAFQDGSYLELIAFWEPDYDAHRWHRFQNTGAGLIDHALGSDDLARELEALRERGIAYNGPNPGARSRPDGVQLEWRTAHPAGISDHGLPFLIDDITDRSLRVPHGDDARHANGVTGIDRLQVLVADLATTGATYAQLLDQEAPEPVLSEEAGEPTQCISLRAGPHTIEIHQPEGNGELAERITRFGDGPLAVRFTASQALEVAPETIDGARISAIAR